MSQLISMNICKQYKSMAEVDLGFTEERKTEWLSNRYFPSKIGGKPAWLELAALPVKESLQCQKCSEPMSFLCQIYAPGQEEYNFHRTIYVFICREPACQILNESENLAVFRSQLPLKNDFYAEEPPAEDGEPEPEIVAKKKLCNVCGCPGPLTCGRCRESNYCSSKHQRAMWPYHKTNCGQASSDKPDNMPLSELQRIQFPENEIVIEPCTVSTNSETDTGKSASEPDLEQKRLKDFEELASQGKTGTFTNLPDTELEKYVQNANDVDDKHFRRFKKEISNEPDQIIRYKRGGEPLWIADVEQTIASQIANIPECTICGAVREFEFQIMPQMLISIKDDNLDWGVLAIYTCSKNCKIPKEIGYSREYIVKQDVLFVCNDKK